MIVRVYRSLGKFYDQTEQNTFVYNRAKRRTRGTRGDKEKARDKRVGKGGDEKEIQPGDIE